MAEVTKLAGFEFTEHVVYSEEGNIIALRGLNIKDGRLVLDDVKYIDGSNFSKLNRSKLYVDDIMFTYVGTVGEVAIIKENDRFYLAPNVSRIRVQSEDSSKFISHYIRSEFFYNRVIFPLIATSSQPALSMENIRKFDIFLPIINEEQIRISELFDTLDQQITLHQRKLDTLKEQKKTYLKLLFPAKGQTKPALRFQGFEDDWEEVKLGEVLVEYNKKSEIENQFELLSSTNSGIEPRSGRVSGESNIGYKIIKRGMVVLSPQNLWLGNINYNAKFEIGIVSPSYKVFNINGPNELYLATVLRLPKMFFEYAQASVQGASIVRRNLDLDLFSSILVQLPSLPEQEVIGTFFQTLDQEIAQVEDKLASLKEMKKTLLRKLFV
ncbi:restriction endonuclease subunit S [Streptococcus suis]